jgi:hypothetical protein
VTDTPTDTTPGSESGTGTRTETETDGETETETTAPTASPASTADPPTRCRGEPVSVERCPTDDPGYEDGFEYISANRTVRYVAGSSRRADGDGGSRRVTRSETIPFDRWGRTECARAAAERAREVVVRRLDAPSLEDPGHLVASVDSQPEWSDAAGSLGDEADGTVVVLRTSTVVDRGEVERTPAVPIERIVGAGPRSVAATVKLEGQSISRRFPVFARHGPIYAETPTPTPTPTATRERPEPD